MKSPLLVLHDAQYERLKAQTSYTILDDHPQQKAYPYVIMGEVNANDWSDKLKPGMEVFSTFHIWSQYRGKKEVEEMTDGILQALTLSAFDLTPDFRAVLDMLDSINIIIDIDGITRHGILRLKYLIEEI